MTYQSGRNILVGFRAESSFGTTPAGTGAQVFRANSGVMNLTKQPIQSGENRRDGMMTRGRHGYREVAVNYTADLSLGTFDDLFEAVFRGTWDAPLVLTQVNFTGLTIGSANVITLGSGDPRTLGLRIHDVIRITDHSAAANNNRNLRITGLSASTITVAETLTTAGSDTAVTITRPTKLLQGTTARSFSFEELESDIDGSELFSGVRIGQMRLQMQPNGMVTVTFSGAGKNMVTLDGSNSPYFVSPTATTSLGMTAVEAVIRLNSGDVVDLTAFDLTLDLKAAPVQCIGSTTTPEIFTNLADVQMNLTALRSSLAYVNNFLDEDDMSLHVLFTENEDEPKDFISLAVPYFTLATATKSELGQDNARTTAFTGLVGIDERGTASGYDASMVKLQTSA